jgi:cytochrome c oxidase subunit III
MEFTTEELPVGARGKRALGFAGLLTLIATEGALFGYLLVSYYYLAAQSTEHWPPDGLPELGIGSANTAILLGSSVVVWAAERLLKKQQRVASMALLSVAILMGIVFAAVQLHEWRGKTYSMVSNQYGSLYFTITGFHLAHVVVGLVVLSFLLLWIKLGYIDERRIYALTIGGMYWHFVDAVWLFVFTTFYLTPYL